MKNNFSVFAIVTILSALLFAACQPNKPAENKPAANASPVNQPAASNSNSESTRPLSQMTREEFENNKLMKAMVEREIVGYAGSKVGQGKNDLWLLYKTFNAIQSAKSESDSSKLLLDDSAIGIDVEDAQVTLHGYTTSAEKKAKAEAVAKSVEGVKSVKNQLEIRAGGAKNDSKTNGNVNTR